ncbi:DUF2157 domain-containing protein [Nocardioides sp. Y6]|uniref:DUF2157 domain-containing protein n=1 Tax=Nocardioides malaquae TaxID=2773426 RepID=A0ABR9RU11_9ACTN|nr:DUF2157 domain-containing protein [Nocardioides malaquae]MBE7325023.1 DUF2157 domain-containing protein [Nocardioides malaquae]
MTRTSTPPAPPGAPRSPSEGVSPRQLQWLRTQVEHWTSEGIVTPDQASTVLARYHATRTFSLTRLLFSLGAVFVGVGLIWLVAANLDVVPPLGRLALVAALWLTLLVGAEVMAGRGVHHLAVGAVRLLAAFAVGGLVFQAAQSLQVPAYEPKLVGLWGAAALLHAYAFRATAPLAVGAVAGVVWSIWQGLAAHPSFADVTFVLAATGVAALGVAAFDVARQPRFADLWRTLGVTLVLAGLFAAALPVDDGFDLSSGWWNVTLGVLLGATVVVAILRARLRLTLVECLGAVAALGLALLLVWWEAGDSVEEVTTASWAHTVVAVVGYVAVAVGVAVIGTLRDSRTLPAVATLALVVFTTFQSFAVFAPIVDGAWLFLLLGLVLLATGWGFDRVRRRLAAALDEPGEADADSPGTVSPGPEGGAR